MMTLKERISRLVDLKEREAELKAKIKIETNTMTLKLTQDWELELHKRSEVLLTRKSYEIQLERVRSEINEEMNSFLDLLVNLELERIEFDLGDKTVVIQRTEPNLLIIKNKKPNRKEVKVNEG
jgi:hypothetical protein